MSKTWKLILVICAMVLVFFCCVPICYFYYLSITSEVTREPTREEWASAPKGDGVYRVGNQREMTLGRWVRTSNKYGCEWKTSWDGNERESASRGLHTIEAGSGKTVLIDADVDYFETRGCGTWRLE